jgi:hypothetical protein
MTMKTHWQDGTPKAICVTPIIDTIDPAERANEILAFSYRLVVLQLTRMTVIGRCDNIDYTAWDEDDRVGRAVDKIGFPVNMYFFTRLEYQNFSRIIRMLAREGLVCADASECLMIQRTECTDRLCFEDPEPSHRFLTWDEAVPVGRAPIEAFALRNHWIHNFERLFRLFQIDALSEAEQQPRRQEQSIIAAHLELLRLNPIFHSGFQIRPRRLANVQAQVYPAVLIPNLSTPEFVEFSEPATDEELSMLISCLVYFTRHKLHPQHFYDAPPEVIEGPLLEQRSTYDSGGFRFFPDAFDPPEIGYYLYIMSELEQREFFPIGTLVQCERLITESFERIDLTTWDIERFPVGARMLYAAQRFKDVDGDRGAKWLSPAIHAALQKRVVLGRRSGIRISYKRHMGKDYHLTPNKLAIPQKLHIIRQLEKDIQMCMVYGI